MAAWSTLFDLVQMLFLAFDLERRRNRVFTGNYVTAGATFYLHICKNILFLSTKSVLLPGFPAIVFLAPLAALTPPPSPVCLFKVWPLCYTCVHWPPSLEANCCVHLCLLAASWFLNVLINYYRFCLPLWEIECLLCYFCVARETSQYWFKSKAESYCIITWSTAGALCALHWSC